ncbi:peptidoglycan recognition protein [Streptomyces sp. DH24]|uniref:peptidoglycan recognition protein family protein n=1 Tax=Streptomyces sp. DH24 TaxID=3040123 RepID=UPI002442B527|nr:peptidoglycan recognition protein [Streptomyces sp. DH24]MDG9719060.1 peptidoglycan recognition protein [Streptomyces sp. DH24]
MRGFLASSIGVTCAAALALPLTPPATAATARPAPTAEAAGHPVPGSTQSLPLEPLARDRATGAAGAAEQGLSRRAVRHFSLVGVVWDDPEAELHGRVQVRTRAAGTGTWSGWQDLETHNADHAADPDTAERASGRVRGATAPLWVGESDGVEVRVRAEADGTRSLGDMGLRLELVDPGAGDRGAFADGSRYGGAPDAEATAASAANADLAPLGATEIPALSREETERELLRSNERKLRGPAGRELSRWAGRGLPRPAGQELPRPAGQELPRRADGQRAKPYVGPRPGIVTRRGWGANEGLRERKFVYTKKVRAAFVHHTASGNNYRCSQVPSLIRGIYRYHVKSMGWRDVGYNFLIDKCGKIYEGRAGGVAKPVLGAHTLGFNSNSMGIAVLGSYGSSKPPSSAVRAVSRLTAWKLGLFGMNPRGKTYLKSGGGNLYRKGRYVRLNVISGHRDGFATECPGRKLYGKLGSARSAAARLQGR